MVQRAAGIRTGQLLCPYYYLLVSGLLVGLKLNGLVSFSLLEDASDVAHMHMRMHMRMT